jgi:hypothetical protein
VLCFSNVGAAWCFSGASILQLSLGIGDEACALTTFYATYAQLTL